MILFSPAKINIGLHILRKREDGYHDISTLMYPVSLSDILEFQPGKKSGEEFSWSQSGIIVEGDLESNLCYKAWKIFSMEYGRVSVRIHLHKNIPLGAGLGGGSSNAASVLKGINSIKGNPLDEDHIFKMAAQIGSDCSFFIKNEPALAKGRGEILSIYPKVLSNAYLVLIHPSIHISTDSAYKQSVPNDKRIPLEQFLEYPISKWKEFVANDFETTVFSDHPEISTIKSALYDAGAIYASMSGSGSSVYGIFGKKPVLEKELQKKVIWQGTL